MASSIVVVTSSWWDV